MALTARVETRLPLPPAFRYRNYLLYWLGLVASVVGFRSFEFAQFWLIHELTGSPVYLGVLGLASGLPAIVLNVAGGVAADRLNRRTLVIVTQLALGSLVLILGILTATGTVTPVHVLIVAALVSGVNSFNTSARSALYPRYVEREALLSAVALNSAAWQTARVLAPAVAGVVIASFGTAPAYFLAASGALALAAIMVFLPNAPQERSGERALRDLADGLRFIVRTPVFAFLIAITFVTSFFALSYVTLMPVFVVDVLGVGAAGQGTLLAAAGVGALLVAITVGVRRSLSRPGIAIGAGALATGTSLILFSVATQVLGSFPLAVVAIFAVGVSMTIFNMSVMTTLQLLVPDLLRGRVIGFWAMTWDMVTVGGIFLGLVAARVGAPGAVAIGAAIVLVTVALPAFALPSIRRLQTGDAADQMAG